VKTGPLKAFPKVGASSAFSMNLLVPLFLNRRPLLLPPLSLFCPLFLSRAGLVPTLGRLDVLDFLGEALSFFV